MNVNHVLLASVVSAGKKKVRFVILPTKIRRRAWLCVCDRAASRQIVTQRRISMLAITISDYGPWTRLLGRLFTPWLGEPDASRFSPYRVVATCCRAPIVLDARFSAQHCSLPASESRCTSLMWQRTSNVAHPHKFSFKAQSRLRQQRR